jgi:hypothetical protein
MSELYTNFRDIKQFEDRDREIQELLRRPGVENKINAIAATLNDTFSATTKLIVDIRPGAIFYDKSTKVEYIYEATHVPYDIGTTGILIFRAAKQPYEELQDQGYITFYQKGLSGSKYIMGLRDFIKCVAVDKFVITEFNISDEREMAKNIVI